MKMKLTSIIKISLFVGPAAAVPDDLLHTNELGSVKNKDDGVYGNSGFSGATLDLLDEVKDVVSSPSGLRGADADVGLFNNGDNVPSNENHNRQHSKLIQPPVNVTVVENEYLVVLEESVADVGGKMDALVRVVNQLRLGFEAEGFGSLWNINDTFKGQAVKMTHEQAETMSEMDGVKYIESNVELVDQNNMPKEEADNEDGILTSANAGTAFELPDNWNLDRIDQKFPKLDGKPYDPKFDGTGVIAIILGKGIRASHDEFKRDDGTSIRSDLIPDDQANCNILRSGGGTLDAAIVGGKTLGVAKGVELVDMRISCTNKSGPVAAISKIVDVFQFISGISSTKKVVNGSRLFNNNDTQNSVRGALDAMIGSGVVYVVEAGDGTETSTCESFPANLENVITVGATQLDRSANGRFEESLLSRQNTACADIYAPGVRIKTAKGDSDSATTVSTGTSIAAAHVTGAVAMLLQEGISAAQVKAVLLRRSAPLRTSNRDAGPLQFVQVERKSD